MVITNEKEAVKSSDEGRLKKVRVMSLSFNI
jgi:hypothetical protein